MAVKAFERILVGVELDPEAKELTPGSERAVGEALRLAHWEGAELVFLHSTFHDETWDPIAARAYIVNRGVSAPGHVALDGLVLRAQAQNLTASVEVVAERPLLALIHRVQKGDLDLLVVGKRNKVEADSRRLGSVAIKLLRKCPGPVLVVRPEEDGAGGSIVAATDLTPVGRLAVHHAARLAERFGKELHVVHAYQVPFELVHEKGRTSEDEHRSHMDALRAQALAGVAADLAGTGMETKALVHVGHTSPDRGIREAVERLKPELLVMGTISRTGIAGLIVGTTAERLLGSVECSILAVKPEDFVSPIGPVS